MDIRFSLRQIELFVAIAREGSVSAAAAALGMSQSAASTALGELEGRYRCALFDRIGKRLRLSEAGHRLLPAAVATIDQALAADALLRGHAGPGPIRIGATQTVGAYLAPRLIADWRQRHPDSPIALTIGNTAEIGAMVEHFAIDLGLVEGEHRAADLIGEDWIEDELALICAAGHPLAGRAGVTIDDLLAEAWVVREPGSGTRQTLDRAMARHGHRWRIAIELQQPQAIVELVAADRLIGCVSRLAAAPAIALGRIAAIELPGIDLKRRLTILRHRAKRPTVAMAAMLELCAGMAR
jgi:DNA-binding transcriptional LysR family regulator